MCLPTPPSSTFGFLVMMHLGVFPFVSIVFGALCASWIHISIFLHKIRDVFLHYFLFFNFLIFYCCSSTVVSVFPHLFPQPQPSPPPTLDPNSLWFCPCVLYTCSLMILPTPCYPLPFLSGYYLFFISMSLIIFYFLDCFVS